MAEVPTSVLSEHFEHLLSGRRLVAAVFTTFRFEPSFFEQEILPVFFDIPASHIPGIRLAQLEVALRDVEGGIAVYYDHNGIDPSDGGGARLDIARLPIRHQRGVFHPKLAFLLVEKAAENDETSPSRSLIIACMSANLTRAGWWRNVEVCHTEELQAECATRLRDDVIEHLRWLRSHATARNRVDPLENILKFIRATVQRQTRSLDGELHPHFYAGNQSVCAFLKDAGGNALRGMHLEIISPYFDDHGAKPLQSLIEQFKPRSTRVYLPTDDGGAAKVSADAYAAIAALDGVEWASLPASLLRTGKAVDAKVRTVHAKVYRFYSSAPKREILFIGSPNLTTAAHSGSANVECGVLVEIATARRPEPWLTPLTKAVRAFTAPTDDDSASSSSSPLALDFDWSTGLAHAYWDARAASSELTLRASGEYVSTLPLLTPRTWTQLSSEISERIQVFLSKSTLFTSEHSTLPAAILLVQECGMEFKPSLVRELAPADILKYWALLTPEQRHEFIQTHMPYADPFGLGADVDSSPPVLDHSNSLFDRFAGIFHAFDALERATVDALSNGREQNAAGRIFGSTHDSLGSLLDGLAKHPHSHDSKTDGFDIIDRYLITLCAKQCCASIAYAHPNWWMKHEKNVALLHERLSSLKSLRAAIETHSAEMPQFLKWFEFQFLTRARLKTGASS